MYFMIIIIGYVLGGCNSIMNKKSFETRPILNFNIKLVGKQFLNVFLFEFWIKL